MNADRSWAGADREPGLAPPRSEFLHLLRAEHGLDASGYDESFLAKSLEKRVAATSGQTAAAYLDRLRHDRA